MGGATVFCSLSCRPSRLAVDYYDVSCLYRLVREPERVDNARGNLVAFESCTDEHEIANIRITDCTKNEPFVIYVSPVYNGLYVDFHFQTSLAATAPAIIIAPRTTAIHPVGGDDQTDGA